MVVWRFWGTSHRLCIAFVFAALGACSQAEKKSPYPILDSGMLAGDSSAITNIYWIDNQRVLFRAVKNNDKRMAHIGPYNLSVWDIRKGVSPYTPYAHDVTACLRDSIFRYTLEDEQKNVQLFHGPFGEEKLIPQPPKFSYFDDINCRFEDDPEIAQLTRNGRAIIKLLAKHGFLDVGPNRGKESSENRQAELHIKGNPQAITLPIRRFELSGIKYFEFNNAYYFANPGAYARTGQPASTKWLYPDGRVEEVLIPIGPWAASPTSVYPTKHGYFVVSDEYASMSHPGIAGGYFIQGEKIVKAIHGSIRGVAVSPDGCKIALSHARTLMDDVATSKDPAKRTLKVIDFCI